MMPQREQPSLTENTTPKPSQEAVSDNSFYQRLTENGPAMSSLFNQLYGQHPYGPHCWNLLQEKMIDAQRNRPATLKQRDLDKAPDWFLSNELAGMSLYVDRFCNRLSNLPSKLDYLQELGINLLHLMPLFESPEAESDGGYAVSNFRKVNPRFGDLPELKWVQSEMQNRDMYLMLDIVLNHTSHHHAWAKKAMEGEKNYQDYFYLFEDRSLPDQFDAAMPDIFPESSPGNFTWNEAMQKWVMTVFHSYQWDLNYRNPMVFVEMLDTIFFYANLGVDLLRIDAPAFIWKEPGSSCQNLPQAHILLQLIKLCTKVAVPGMALLGEAIVAPAQIMEYFGTGANRTKECDFAYNATQMALLWDALATGDTRVMLAAQEILQRKPEGCSWISYTRCHDDIGLGYDDYMIDKAGYNPYEHRRFLKNYYSGNFFSSDARGALFSVNPKTQDARISGTLASLCGLESALERRNEVAIDQSIQKILLMQAHSFFLGGLPMLYYGDELGYCNDYSYVEDPAKSYDNRWMHRPQIDWQKADRRKEDGSIENRIFRGTARLLAIRKSLPEVADHSNIDWLQPYNQHIAGYLRAWDGKQLYCLFNFSDKTCYVSWHLFKQHAAKPSLLFDHWSEKYHYVGYDHDHFELRPFDFYILEAR